MSRTTKTKRPTQQLFKALSHELRAEVLTYLVEHGKSSPNEMSETLGGTTTDISHHAHQLVAYGCAELVEEKKRRGATEHFYIATIRPLLDTGEWEKLTRAERNGFSAVIAGRVLDDLQRAFLAGSIDEREDRHMSRTPLLLDEKGCQETMALLDKTVGRILNIQARSDERRSKSGEEGTRVSASMLGFTIPQ